MCHTEDSEHTELRGTVFAVFSTLSYGLLLDGYSNVIKCEVAYLLNVFSQYLEHARLSAIVQFCMILCS